MRFIIIIFLLFLPTNAIAQRVAIQGLIGTQLPEGLVFIENGPIVSSDKDVEQGSTNNAVLAFRLRTESGTDRGIALHVVRSGTCPAADIPLNGAKLYIDANSDGEFDIGDVLQATTSFNADFASFTGLNLQANTTGVDYIVTYDIAGAATIGCTLVGGVRLIEMSYSILNRLTPQATLIVVEAPAGFLITDSFTDTEFTLLTDHTLDTGESWVAHPTSTTTPRIQNNKLFFIDAFGVARHYVDVSPGTANYTIQITFEDSTVGSVPRAILGRLDLTNDTSYSVDVARNPFTNITTWTLAKRISGVITILDQFIGDSPFTTPRVVRFVLLGTNLEVFIDDVSRLSAIDGDITAEGRIGIHGFTTEIASIPDFDNFSAFE